MVSDSGPGIPMSEREAVLRRFHRTEKSRHERGSGLGLSLVVAVARLHKMDAVSAANPEISALPRSIVDRRSILGLTQF